MNHYYTSALKKSAVTVLALSVALLANLKAQTNFGAFQDNNFFNANNWTNGLPAPGNDGTVVGGVSASISSPLIIDFTLTSYGTIQANADVSIQASGTLNNYSGSVFDLNGSNTLTNEGAMDQRGALTIAAGATFRHRGSYSSTGAANITNHGTLSLQNDFANLGTITNHGVFEILTGQVTNNTAIQNTGTLHFGGGTLTNVNGANLQNAAGGTLDQLTGAILENEGGGTIINAGTWQNTGEINSNGIFQNDGLFNNNTNGSFDNYFKLLNNGTFNLNNQSYLLNEFELNNAGEFNNNFYLDNGAYINNLPGGSFAVAPAAQINNQFGATIVNENLFSNKGEIISVGDIVNKAVFTNDGAIYTNTGGGVFNDGTFYNNSLLNNLEIIKNTGTFWNNGSLMNNSGGAFTNEGDLYNDGAARISNQFDLINNSNIYNSGTVENGVRVFNNHFFENRGYLVNIGEFVNGSLAVFENTVANASGFGGVIDNINGGVFTNHGTINNHNELFNLDCSSFVNYGIINNYYWFTNAGLFFNFGTFNALPYHVMHKDGGVEINGTSSDFVCEDITANLDENGLAELTGAALSISFYDNCEALNLTINGSATLTLTCADIGTHVLTLEIADRTGVSVKCSSAVTLVDDMGPVFQNCPADIVIISNENATPANWTPPTATDNCTDVTITATHQPGDSFPKGSTKVAYNATDDHGNGAAECSFLVTIVPDGDCSGVLAVRRVSNTNDFCGSWCNGEYTFTFGAGNCMTAGEDLLFIEYQNGTALLIGSLFKGDERFFTQVNFSGRTGNPPAGSPKYGLCVNQGAEDWTYFTHFEGTITTESGYRYHFVRFGPAFQMGKGGNLQDKELFGASGWVSQNGGASNGGDFNFRLSDPLPCQNSIALEAECADVIGSRWSVLASNDASGGQFLLPPNSTSYNYPPLDNADLLRFKFKVDVSGHYRIYARSSVANGASDSYWLRTNYGTWIKWNTVNIENRGAGFQWDLAGSWNGGDAAIPVTFWLEAGENILEISWREPNTKLDKVFITLAGQQPTGFGPDAENCDATNPPVCEEVTIKIKPDKYGEDITWKLKDASGNVIASGGPYPNDNTDVRTYKVCLTAGCYTFKIYDSYGDGICCAYGEGWYRVTNANGEVLASNGDYTSKESKTFCIGEQPPAPCNKSALFVVGSLDLNSGDKAVSDRLKGLGFEVALVEDDNVKTSDSDGKGIVLISSTVSSSKVGSRFTQVNIPVMTWEAWLFDDLKMTGSSSGSHYGTSEDQKKIKITDSNHPIAQGVSGSLEILTKSKTVSWGLPTASAYKIGIVPGYPDCVMLFAYETGSSMKGMTAPGRRVGFFLQNSTATKLNSTGWLLFDRTVQWAIGCDLGVAASALQEVLTFTATKADRFVNLYWSNNTGFRNDRFVVERSVDGHLFEPIFEMPAYFEEDNSRLFFETTDLSPVIGVNYYRVSLFHNDGSVSYSDIQPVEINAIEAFTLYPNPARSYTRIGFEGIEDAGPVAISVSDLAGRVLKTVELEATDLPYYELDLSDLQEGQYSVSLLRPNKLPVLKKLMIGK